MSGEKILIVDDEKKIVKLIKAYLEKEGYLTLEAYDGEMALELWRREKPELVVLDILMPGIDGLEFCREVRKSSHTPIIMLTAKSEEIDKLVGLELGADDYMTKPFSPRELIARIRAVLRRHKLGSRANESTISEGPLFIHKDRYHVEIAGEEVSLTPTEFNILMTLASHPGRVYSRGQLIKLIQGEFFEGYERTVDAHIKNIRKKLGEQAIDWSFVETVYGIGYKFQARKKV